MEPYIRVGDVMTREFVHAKPDASLLDCAKLMIKKRVGSVLLKDKENIHGIVTEKDIIWTITKKQGKDLDKVPAKDIATRKLRTIKPESTLEEALNKMLKSKVRRLPVMSNKNIIGFITLKDILRFKPSLFNALEEFHAIKEESEKIQRSNSAIKGNYLEAPCEECGNFDILSKIDGRMICESCRDEM